MIKKNNRKSKFFVRLLYEQNSFVPEGLVAHSQIQVHSRAAFLHTKDAFDLKTLFNR